MITNSIDALLLRKKLLAHEDIQLIDVREAWEHELNNIGGTLIPLSTIFENIAQINTEKPVVLYCEKGIRSLIAIQRLEARYGYSNLINLTGGMSAWRLL